MDGSLTLLALVVVFSPVLLSLVPITNNLLLVSDILEIKLLFLPTFCGQ